MTADVIAEARAQQRTILSEVEAKQVLAQAGLNVTETRLATSIDEAAAHAAELGYPVALKVVSHKITHKTDVGGVELGVADEDALRAACHRIHDRVVAAVPEPEAQGVSVQPMAEPGVEVILGITQDQQFGPVLMFGLGGVFVEVLKDVAFRIVPLEPRDASEMIREIQGFPILEGVRGQPAANLEAIESMLLQLSEFAEANPEIAELDLNPVFARPDGAIAVDARILLTSES